MLAFIMHTHTFHPLTGWTRWTGWALCTLSNMTNQFHPVTVCKFANMLADLVRAQTSTRIPSRFVCIRVSYFSCILHGMYCIQSHSNVSNIIRRLVSLSLSLYRVHSLAHCHISQPSQPDPADPSMLQACVNSWCISSFCSCQVVGTMRKHGFCVAMCTHCKYMPRIESTLCCVVCVPAVIRLSLWCTEMWGLLQIFD